MSRKTANSETDIDTEAVRELAELLTRTELSEIEVQKGDLRIRVARQMSAAPMLQAMVPAAQAVASAAPAPAAVAPPLAADAVRSPMVGTAYLRPSPGAKAFIEVGSTVRLGDRLLLIEAMKTFNEIVANKSGSIAAILITDGQPVEFDQPLVTIE